MQGSKIIVAEGLQEVEASKISLTQLRNILKAKKMYKNFNISKKSTSLYNLFQYGAVAFLKHNIIKVTDKWTPDLSTISRENVAKVGSY